MSVTSHELSDCQIKLIEPGGGVGSAPMKQGLHH